MTRFVLDVRSLYEALDLERARRGYSWRQIGRQTGIAPSTFTRLRKGTTPSADIVCSLLWWLNHQIGNYITRNPEDIDARCR